MVFSPTSNLFVRTCMTAAGLSCWLLLSAAGAGASSAAASASFTVGIVIGGKPSKPHAPPRVTYTWGAAQISLARAGFRDIRRLERRTGNYWFSACGDSGEMRLAVSAATGKLIAIMER